MSTTTEWIGLPDVPQCGWCQRSDVSKQQLKRCGGCGAVRYCSKECQRTAWPYHKSTCRSQDDEETGAEQAGYTAPLSLAQAVKEWANIHKDALSTIVHAIVRIEGGVDWALNNERSMVFYLRPLQRLFDNPATALDVSSLVLVGRDMDTGDNDEPFRDLWEEPFRVSRALDAARIAASDPNPRFAGLLPATFMVIDTEVVLHSYYRMYRPKDHDDRVPVAEPVEAAFRDISRLCVYAAGVALVLRKPTPSAPLFPQVGYMVQERKKWVWKPMRNPASLLAMTMDEDDQPRRSQLSLQELWKLWLQW